MFLKNVNRISTFEKMFNYVPLKKLLTPLTLSMTFTTKI